MNQFLKKYVKYPIENFAVALIYSTKLFGYKKSSDIVGYCFKKLGKFIKKRDQIASKNLDIIFATNPKSESEKRIILDDMWENWGRTAADYCNLDYIYKNFNNLITVTGLDNLCNNAIYISAHFSNFEMAVLTLVKNKINLAQLYRGASNKIFNKIGLYTQKNIPKQLIDKQHDGIKRIIKTLSDGNSVFMLTDQRASSGGINIDFFGKNALTAKGAAVLSNKYDVPIIPIYVTRSECKYKFFVTIEKPIQRNLSINDTTTEINKIFEKWIEKKPSEWLLIHNRWKNA